MYEVLFGLITSSLFFCSHNLSAENPLEFIKCLLCSGILSNLVLLEQAYLLIYISYLVFVNVHGIVSLSFRSSGKEYKGNFKWPLNIRLEGNWKDVMHRDSLKSSMAEHAWTEQETHQHLWKNGMINRQGGTGEYGRLKESVQILVSDNSINISILYHLLINWE